MTQLLGCRTLNQISRKSEAVYLQPLSIQDENYIRNLYDNKGYKLTNSSKIRAYINESTFIKDLHADLSDGNSKNSQISFSIKENTQVYLAKDKEKNVLVCQYYFFLSADNHILNRMLIFGKFIDSASDLANLTRISFTSDIFVSYDSVSANNALQHCSEIKLAKIANQVEEYFKVFPVNMLYPVQTSPCHMKGHLLANKQCDEWFQRFISIIKDNTYPVCRGEDETNGFCELRSKVNKKAAAFLNRDRALKKIPTDSHDFSIRNLDLRFICEESNEHYNLEEVQILGVTEHYMCAMNP